MWGSGATPHRSARVGHRPQASPDRAVAGCRMVCSASLKWPALALDLCRDRKGQRKNVVGRHVGTWAAAEGRISDQRAVAWPPGRARVVEPGQGVHGKPYSPRTTADRRAGELAPKAERAVSTEHVLGRLLVQPRSTPRGTVTAGLQRVKVGGASRGAWRTCGAQATGQPWPSGQKMACGQRGGEERPTRVTSDTAESRQTGHYPRCGGGSRHTTACEGPGAWGRNTPLRAPLTTDTFDKRSAFVNTRLSAPSERDPPGKRIRPECLR